MKERERISVLKYSRGFVVRASSEEVAQAVIPCLSSFESQRKTYRLIYPDNLKLGGGKGNGHTPVESIRMCPKMRSCGFSKRYVEGITPKGAQIL